MISRNNKPQANGLLLIIILIAFVVAYFPVLKKLVMTWVNSDEYSHGFFIIPICFYIIWLKQKHLSSIPLKPSSWGIVVTVFSLIIYFLASFAGITTLCSLTIVSLWAGIIIYLYGAKMLRALAFPLFLLFFMIPVPAQIYSALTIPLQLFVSQMSVLLASNFGVPIFGEGNIIQLKDRTLEVVEACSGLRSLISLLTLSLIGGYFFLNSNRLRGILFLSAIPVAIFVNILRVLIIVLALYYFNLDFTLDEFHTWFGLGIFLLAFLIIVAERGVLRIWDHSVEREL